jgi:hypothetical protein
MRKPSVRTVGNYPNSQNFDNRENFSQKNFIGKNSNDTSLMLNQRNGGRFGNFGNENMNLVNQNRTNDMVKFFFEFLRGILEFKAEVTVLL